METLVPSHCLLHLALPAEAWADALHRWLGITADRMHIVHNGKDAQNVPKSAEFLIVSYNFVQKMVRPSKAACMGQPSMRASSLKAQ